MSKLIRSDLVYKEWIQDVSRRFRRSQLKAAVKVNDEMLRFYWSLGQDISRMNKDARYGTEFYKTISRDLKDIFPDVHSFSPTNLKYMRYFYEMYPDVTNRQQLVDDFKTAENRQQAADEFDAANNQQPIDQLEMPEIFGRIPWFHHVQIISKCKTLDEAQFYIHRVLEEGWSRSRLENQIAANLFGSQGAAITNFSSTLPDTQSQLAKEILKDPYHFDFLSMKEGYEEEDLEDALVSKVTQFLLELGKGFSYVGRQMELQMPGGQTFFPDLLFYHIPQHRYVVVELKVGKFIPEYAGKLNFYVTAVDELLRAEGDNPTVGLIICKSTDKTVVEWSLKDINKPLGVSTYQLEQVVERTVRELEQRKGESGGAERAESTQF